MFLVDLADAFNEAQQFEQHAMTELSVWEAKNELSLSNILKNTNSHMFFGMRSAFKKDQLALWRRFYLSFANLVYSIDRLIFLTISLIVMINLSMCHLCITTLFRTTLSYALLSDDKQLSLKKIVFITFSEPYFNISLIISLNNLF